MKRDSRSAATTPVAAVQAIHDALKSFEGAERSRILSSALALLGMAGQGGGGQDSAVERGGTQTSSGQGNQRQTPAGLRPVSLREVMDKAAPASFSQNIAVFAYHREKHEDLPRFSRADLRGYFSKAKLTPPSTYDREFTKAVKLGWIHEEGDDSYLTTKGLEAVEAGFGGKQLPRGKAVAKRRRGRARKPGRGRSGR